MSRLPPLAKEKLPSKEAQEAHDYLKSHMQGVDKYATLVRKSDGALLGPLPLYLQQPAVATALMDAIKVIAKVPGLTPEARETAIVAVGSHFKAAYELYAHINVAVKGTDLTAEQVEQIAKGEKPKGLDAACSAAFDVAIYLSKTPGPLPQSMWDASIKALGQDGTTALIHYVGLYAYTCMILNAIDAPVPQDGE